MTFLGANFVAGIAGVLVLGSAGCVSSGVHDAPAPREWYREGSGRAVVMLGGGVYGAAMFAPHARELSSDFDVIRVQTLNVQTAGRGAPMPADYSVVAEVSALQQTLSVIGLTGQVDLVGSSYGAVVALHFAATYPERVRTLTLFEPPVFWILPDAEYERDAIAGEIRNLTRAMTPPQRPQMSSCFVFAVSWARAPCRSRSRGFRSCRVGYQPSCNARAFRDTRASRRSRAPGTTEDPGVVAHRLGDSTVSSANERSARGGAPARRTQRVARRAFGSSHGKFRVQ